MKKLIIALSVLSGVCISEASYLYWQVNPADTGLVASQSASSGYSFNGIDIEGFRIVAKSDSETPSYQALTTYDAAIADSPTPTTGGSVYLAGATAINSDQLYADISAYKTGYSYYIELMSSESSVIGVSSDGLTYADSLSQITTTLGGNPLSGGQLAAWSGSGAYAVPEPTGAMLMIFGLAMLGLKRRKA